MSSDSAQSKNGTIYTFYSYKGGVGRSMALANVAAILAKWGRSVLVVDWDLEAPGIERFFSNDLRSMVRLSVRRPGVLELLQSCETGTDLGWSDCVYEILLKGNGATISLITAGSRDEHYASGLNALDFDRLFNDFNAGEYIERLRNEWKEAFDFIFIDSRTGVTDIGGVCTVHLADVLVPVFTTTETSTEGALDIVRRARVAQSRLPRDRDRLLAVPLLARDESRTEYENAMKWRDKVAEEFKDLYLDWLPINVAVKQAVEILRVPYIAYWSFGERLPVIEEGTSDPSSIGAAYENLARLIASNLKWHEALQGRSLADSPPARVGIDSQWLTHHRVRAFDIRTVSKVTTFVEAWHYTSETIPRRTQSDLLKIARQSANHTLGWLTGVVLDNNEAARPRPTIDGIVAELVPDYWALNVNGDFYTSMELSEIRPEQNAIYFNTRIERLTELLLHCGNLYRHLGVEPTAKIHVVVRHDGLKGRELKAHRKMWGL
ncbi:MAG: AAA family ATPase [Bryobacteraceae bacterium]